MAHNRNNQQYANQYITPETALKQADQHVNEGAWDQALECLVAALQNRRNKGNNQMLERLMVSINVHYPERRAQIFEPNTPFLLAKSHRYQRRQQPSDHDQRQHLALP